MTEKRKKAIIRRRIFLTLCAIILAAIIALTVFIINSIVGKDDDSSSKQQNESLISSDVSSEPEIKESFATVLSTGDIMVHSTQLDGAKVAGTDDYDFSAFFKECSPYYKSADLAVANLEGTFGGTESGKFSG